MEDSQPCTSRNLDHAGNSTTSIPLKLTFEILSRLPAKSIIRFRSVSMLWRSIIDSKDFADAFLTWSRTRPRLLFSFNHLDSRKLFIFSAPEHDKSSTVVARHDMTISNLGYNKRYDAYPYYITCPPVNGLICCTRGSSIAVCNPTTRQLLILPDVRANGRVTHARLGYDPVEDEYKVLCVMMMLDGHERGRRGIKLEQEHVVSTLSSRRPECWRRVETPTGESYTDVEGGLCINGAIYYGVGHNKIARFDLRYEKMMFIQAPKDDDITSWNFINHQGKFGGIEYDYLYEEMRVCIQEKEELWNNMTCSVPCEWGDLFREKRPTCPGEIHTGEVMLVSPRLESSKPFSVLYCDVIQESCRSAQVTGIADFGFRSIHGIGKHDCDILCFPGYIENIMCLSRLH